jgi:hypothetical protein
MRKILWLILISVSVFKIVKITKQAFIGQVFKMPIKSELMTNDLSSQDASNIDIKGLVLTGSANKKDATYIIKSSDVLQVAADQFIFKEIDVAYQKMNFKPIKIFATSGLLDNKSKCISLSDSVKVSGDKYSISSDELEMDLNSSTIKAKAAKLEYIDSRISSDKCVIYNDLKGFKCHGKVKADIYFNGF